MIGQVLLGLIDGSFGDFWHAWLQWMLEDGLGLLVATPAALLPFKQERLFRAPGRSFERSLLLALTVIVAIVSFALDQFIALTLVMPLLVLTAFRAGPGWVYVSVLTTSLVAMSLTANGHGPIAFIAPTAPYRQEFMVQLLIASIAATAVPATAALWARNRSAQRLERAFAAVRKAKNRAEAASRSKSGASGQYEPRDPHAWRDRNHRCCRRGLGPHQAELAPKQRRDGPSGRDQRRLSASPAQRCAGHGAGRGGRVGASTRNLSISRTTCRAIVELFRAKAEEKGLSLELRIAPQIAERHIGDAARLRQVLGNLVSNAIKFTSAAASRHELTPHPRSPGASVGPGAVDTGIGFDAETGQRLVRALRPG
ncbi:MASE1 domain-containing protein [Caulobacter segnis]